MVEFNMQYQAINITRVRGDTVSFRFNVKDSAGAAVDISGFSYKLTVDTLEDPTDDTTKVFQLTGSIVDAANGVVEFSISALQSDQDPNMYYFDLEQTDNASKIRTIAKGQWIVLQDITKA